MHCQPAVGCIEDGPWEYLGEDATEEQLVKAAPPRRRVQAAKLAHAHYEELAASETPRPAIAKGKRAPAARNLAAELQAAAAGTVVEEAEPVSYVDLRDAIKYPKLDISRAKVDARSGLITVPLLYDGSLLQFLTSDCGFFVLPFGLQEPYGSLGGGPIRGNGIRGRPATGLYSAFLEQPETLNGEDFRGFIETLQAAVLTEVQEHKVSLGLQYGNKQQLEEAMVKITHATLPDGYGIAMAGFKVKVPIGGRNSLKCLKAGAATHQGPLTLITARTTVDPTWSVKGIWVHSGKWGITVHMPKVNIVSS